VVSKPIAVGTTIVFLDHPEFTPNLTPRQIFELGSFGGTYWRPIFSGVNSREYKNQHRVFDWSLDESLLSSPECKPEINKYGVTSGTSLVYWESKGWIHSQDPYGWVQWYCRFYAGRRTDDDARQIARWRDFAGPKGRFRLRLINMCKKARKQYDDATVSPVIRQGLQQWAYMLTHDDFISKK
jgi:hypothetical protein